MEISDELYASRFMCPICMIPATTFGWNDKQKMIALIHDNSEKGKATKAATCPECGVDIWLKMKEECFK